MTQPSISEIPRRHWSQLTSTVWILEGRHPTAQFQRREDDSQTLHTGGISMLKPFAFAACILSLFVWSSSWADMGKTAVPLKAMAGSKAEAHIAQGIEHYDKGHWDVAKKHFVEAAQTDPQSAEAHYDVALVLDKMGDHGGATEHFKKAYELGKSNADIQNSDILKKHLKM